MRCYICNREISDNPTDATQCRTHGEHIIHNGIRGKLISKTILCEECGSKYSKEDAAFCKIFDAFIAALNDKLIPADHGKGNPIVLLGSLYDTPIDDAEAPNRPIQYKDGVVTPIEPYHKIEGNKITVYAEKNRIKQYINVLARELQKNGYDINAYTIEKVTDIHDQGYLAYYFSKGKDTFNADFKNGVVKIAAEYALDCGVEREELKDVIHINPDGTATFDCSKTEMFPFVPISVFDILFENGRYFFEDGYPSHSVKVFSTEYSDGHRFLYGYVDLFSTFQYYVILSKDYRGPEINKMYAQRLIPRIYEKPDVSHYRPKDLMIVIQDYKIDMSQCTGDSYQNKVRFVQEYIRKYPLQTYDFQQALHWARERVQQVVTSVLLKHIGTEHPELIEQLLAHAAPARLMASLEVLVTNLANEMDMYQLYSLIQTLGLSADIRCYRAICFDAVGGGVESHSQPDECVKFLNHSTKAVKEYTNAKFSHLNCFCHEPEVLWEDGRRGTKKEPTHVRSKRHQWL